VKACLLKHIKDPYKEDFREAIRNRVDSYSTSVREASLGLMHLVKGMYRDVTGTETVEVPDEFLDKTFIRHLMLGTWDMRSENELVHALHEKYPFCSINGTRYKGDADMHTHGAMRYLTNMKNHFKMNLERFMIRAVFALRPDLSRKGIWTIIDGVTNVSKNEQETEFVNKKTSRRRKNEASVIRAVMHEHRAALGLANRAEEVLDMKKDEERRYRLILHYVMFLNREVERKAEIKLSVEKNEKSEKRKAAVLEKHFNEVPLCHIKSNFVTIDSRVLYGIMKEICPEFNVRKTEFIGENRETYWKSTFDFKRLKVSKQKVFTGIIETNGVSICVHYRRLKKTKRRILRRKKCMRTTILSVARTPQTRI